MTVYILMIVTSLLMILPAQVLDEINKKKRVIGLKKIKTILLFLSLTIPFIVAAVRYNVGTDYIVYSTHQIPRVLSGFDPNFDLVEPIYQLVIIVGNYLGGFPAIFAITHFLIVFMVFLAVKELSTSFLTSMCVFYLSGFYFLSLNLMRQFIAISFLLYSIKYIVNRKFFKYVLVVTLAVGFHRTAFLFYPLYFLHIFNFRNSKKLYILVLSLPIIRMMYPIFRIIVVFLGSLVDRFTIYFYSQHDGITNNFLVLINTIIFICSVIIYDKSNFITHQKDRKLLDVLITIQYISAAVSILIPIIPNGSRIVFIFMFVQILLIPQLLDQKINKVLKSAIMVTIMAVYLVYISFIFKNNAGEILPFNSLF